MGAWSYIHGRLEELSHHPLRYAGRERSPSPAVGSKAIHVLEQDKLVADAFEV
jgi:2-oxoglutarate dehydrogenase E1 component